LKHDESKTGEKENMGSNGAKMAKMGRDHRAQQAYKIKESSLCREACRDPDNLHRCGSHKESKFLS
jgi:hypothetical protein